ncbi:UbiA family prenyltransferase [Candidatus Neomarinimicrobiota bacterium]
MEQNKLDKKILGMLNKGNVLTLATAVGSNPSAANIYYYNDGFDIYFFTFNPSRKAEQIRVNPEVQCVVRPDGEEGIKELQITGYAHQIKAGDEITKAKKNILSVTKAFQKQMDDEFLKKNKITGYYKIVPTVIKYVDFYSDTQFEWKEFPQNQKSLLSSITSKFLKKVGLYFREMRAPFFTASVVPVALGAAVFYYQSGIFHWPYFWLSLLGAVLAHAGTNIANDYSDHITRNDEVNKLFTPFNGGSRVIQAGLMSPSQTFLYAIALFGVVVWIGLSLNVNLHGAYFALSPLLWLGVTGIALGIFYTANPFRLSYHGFGDIAVMLGFGPVMALGTHYVQKQALIPLEAWNFDAALIASIPIAILVGLILFINGFQDYLADREVGKRTWVVRLADTGDIADFERPFKAYKISIYITFLYILVLGILGFFYSQFSSPWVLLALIPFILVRKGIKSGEEWLEKWSSKDANRQILPYELLPVNVTHIGTHLTVGLLLILGYFLGGVI